MVRRIINAAWFLAALAALAVLLSPFFFVLYRLEIFNTLPRDDYAPYLLWLDGNPIGALPASPYIYRLLSVALAWPLLHALPPLPLSNIPADIPEATRRATAALAALSHLAQCATCLLAIPMLRRECGLDRAHAIAAAALLWVLVWYTQITAIDAVALLLITAALRVIRKPWAFAVTLTFSVGINEKIALLLALWLVLRCATDANDRTTLWRQAGIACTAVLLYLLTVKLVNHPGNEYQLRPDSFPLTIAENLQAYLGARGLLLNVLPALVLTAIALAGRHRPNTLFARIDILMIPAMLLVALVLTHLFQAGRLAMHAAPLFIGPALAALQERGNARPWLTEPPPRPSPAPDPARSAASLPVAPSPAPPAAAAAPPACPA